MIDLRQAIDLMHYQRKTVDIAGKFNEEPIDKGESEIN